MDPQNRMQTNLIHIHTQWSIQTSLGREGDENFGVKFLVNIRQMYAFEAQEKR